MYQNEANADIRKRAAAAGVPLWKLALRAGISPTTLSVWMRIPLKPMDPRRLQLMSALTMIEREQHGTEEKEGDVSGR